MTQTPQSVQVQPSLPGLCQVEDALERLARAGVEERGAIFTRQEVVEFILDLVGYTADVPLHHMKLLEPSFGHGDFLLPAVHRLLTSYWTHGRRRPAVDVDELRDCIRAVELHAVSFDETRLALSSLLVDYGIKKIDADELAACWLIQGDFLLTDLPWSFTHVIGNPPYVRQEMIPDALIMEYRSRFETIYDRADIYIPFIEKSLKHLAPGGILGFICADRWMKNRYGGPLRRMIADHFHLKCYIDMFDTPAFHSDVIAYPAITVLAHERPGPTRIAHRPVIEQAVLSQLAATLRGTSPVKDDQAVKEVADVALNAEPWILESFDQLAVVRRLERDFPTIEDAGCKVGIGVATGADRAFIGVFDELDVEPDRKLPLAMTGDIITGEAAWRGLGIINPFADDGRLVNLGQYPKLARYLEARKEQICRRHIALKHPEKWYRTIDRIYPGLAAQPKLLIPDIKGDALIVYEAGRLYPHHNLYYIVSDEWDLKALRAVLRSGIARLFVSTYSTKMRGGYLRYQAQYLRRIRLPRWQHVPDAIKDALIEAATADDRQACNRAVFRLYSLSDRERAAIGGNGE
jgi:hypothetical protein